MKITMRTVKKFLSAILTVLVVGVLFAVIFIRGGWIVPNEQFFKELFVVVGLTLMMKIWWYDYAEDKRLSEDDIKDEKKNYYKILDETVTDTNDLEKYLVILNQENREHFINNKIGSRNAKNLAKKNFWICLFHPSYRKLTKQEIGEIRYAKLYFKVQRKADKIRKITSEEIMALSSTEMLYDTKNYAKQHKRTYQIITTIGSIILTVLFASMALEEIMLNWLNVFRFVGYLCSIVFTIAITVAKAYRQTGDDTFDYYSRLKFIVDKYATYKEKLLEEEKVDG